VKINMKHRINSKFRFFYLIKLCIVFCVFFNGAPAVAQKNIVLNSTFSYPVSTDSQSGFADLVLAEAFRRIGYQLETVRVPAERALINANRGIGDGEMSRVAGLQKKYPNLIQVPESFMVIDMVLFAKNNTKLVVKGWDSVASHSLAIISGWKIMEKNFGKLGDRVDIIKTDNAKQSFTLLKKDRVEFVAYSNWSGLGYIKNNNIKNIKLLQPPLASPKFYVYLHKRHEGIVPHLSKVIKEMKTDGTINEIFNKTLKPLLQ